MLPRGRIKVHPEDFVVEEVPAYEPCGEGEHVYVRFTKRGWTTIDAVRAIARALGCDPREAGVAGLKDRHAVTTQTVSLHARPTRTGGANAARDAAAELAARARELVLEGIEVHDAKLHVNKLKTGHLAGNRFVLTVRDLDPERVDEVVAALARVGREGVPNAFGAQRFGRIGDNVPRALAWLRGEAGPTGQAPPRDPRIQRLLWSSVQSEIFNRVLAERVADGTWATPLAGDLLKVRASGGLFTCTDVETDRARAVAGDVSPTGPIFGVRMRWPEGEPRALEARVVEQLLGAGIDLSRTRSLGEGSRRPLRIWVEELRTEVVDLASDDENAECGKRAACMRVRFVLPRGSYATTVLGVAITIDESRGEGGARDEETPGELTD